MSENNLLTLAFDTVGGQAEMARRLDIPFTTLNSWRGRLPAKHALGVARASGWVVTPHQLAPAHYPNPSDGLPADVVAQSRAFAALDLTAITAEKAPA